MVRFSIVMPSFNQGRFIEAALESILTQDYKNWEIIFIDGGSSDDTMQIVGRYLDVLSYWVSEQDEGQSDALKKGYSQATGDVFTWLNTDDLLLPGALAQAAKAFAANTNRSWLLGNVIWIDDSDKILKCWRGDGYTIGWPRFGLLTAGGPSAFFRRELYERVGGINLDLHYQMDTELWWRFAISGEPFYRLPGYTWALRLHEGAKVSGHIFADPRDENRTRIARRQILEADYISQYISGYVIKLPHQVRSALGLLRKAISPAYLRGRADNYRFTGAKLSRLLDYLSDGAKR
jgi:glycosyltransferase involved in cell wall biosynthesis